MQGIPLIDPETATGAVASLLDTAQRFFGLIPNSIKAMANSPAVLKGYLDFSAALRTGTLPAAARESIAVLVAQENGCDYCLSVHTYLATKVVGLTATDAAEARRGRSADPTVAAVLSFAKVLVADRGTSADVQSAAAAALPPHQMVEVVAHVALDLLTCHLTSAGRVAVDWPLVRHAD